MITVSTGNVSKANKVFFWTPNTTNMIKDILFIPTDIHRHTQQIIKGDWG